jgi:hypothetical protein
VHENEPFNVFQVFIWVSQAKEKIFPNGKYPFKVLKLSFKFLY